VRNFGVHSEVGKLRTVMVCRPGLAHQRLTPGNCHDLLFDDVIWVRRAEEEHAAFVAAVQPVLISVKSPVLATTDAYLQLFNTSSASVTLGGLPQPLEIIKVPYTKTKTVVYFPGADPCAFGSALSIAVTTTPCGGTAADATNAPVTTILYG